MVAALTALYLERARAHGCPLDDAGVAAVLHMDIELNAQGLADMAGSRQALNNVGAT